MAFNNLCTVLNAGIRSSDGQAILLLKSPTFPAGRNFRSAPSITREVLAVALAAITSDRLVYCSIPTENIEWSEITQINLMSGK